MNKKLLVLPLIGIMLVMTVSGCVTSDSEPPFECDNGEKVYDKLDCYEPGEVCHAFPGLLVECPKK